MRLSSKDPHQPAPTPAPHSRRAPAARAARAPPRAAERRKPDLLSRAASQPWPGQRARALAARTVRRGRRWDRDLGRRWRLGPEDILLGPAGEKRLELLLLDRLALDQDLGELLQRALVLCQQV